MLASGQIETARRSYRRGVPRSLRCCILHKLRSTCPKRFLGIVGCNHQSTVSDMLDVFNSFPGSAHFLVVWQLSWHENVCFSFWRCFVLLFRQKSFYERLMPLKTLAGCGTMWHICWQVPVCTTIKSKHCFSGGLWILTSPINVSPNILPVGFLHLLRNRWYVMQRVRCHRPLGIFKKRNWLERLFLVYLLSLWSEMRHTWETAQILSSLKISL